MSVKRDLRKLAMEEVLIFEPADAAAVTQEGSDEDLLSSLSPAERSKVLALAARRLAFQVLFELDSRRSPDAAEAEGILARVRGLEPSLGAHVRRIVSGAYSARRDADTMMEQIAPEWPAHRQAAVDRAILRLAYFEMVGTKTHPRIVINEAVELAKAYSSERAPAFINGVLDKVMKRVSPDHDQQTAPEPSGTDPTMIDEPNQTGGAS